jgi:benzodiazapine receptor
MIKAFFQKPIIQFFIVLIMFEGIGYSIGMLTRPEIPTWYASLNKPPLNPPSWVFAVVWPCLYAILSGLGVFLWRRKDQSAAGMRAFQFFVVQMGFNWAWSFLFFSFHWLGFSVVWILMTLFFAGFSAFYTARLSKIVTLFWLPYLLWLGFAAYLSLDIVLLN